MGSGSFIIHPHDKTRFWDTKITDLDDDTVLVEWKGDRTPRQVAVFGQILGYVRDGKATMSALEDAQYQRILDGAEMATVFWRRVPPDMEHVRSLLRTRNKVQLVCNL